MQIIALCLRCFVLNFSADDASTMVDSLARLWMRSIVVRLERRDFRGSLSLSIASNIVDVSISEGLILFCLIIAASTFGNFTVDILSIEKRL